MKAIRYIKVIFYSNFVHSVLSTVIFAGDQHNQLRKTQKSGKIFSLNPQNCSKKWQNFLA